MTEDEGVRKDTEIEIAQVANGFIVRPADHNWFVENRQVGRAWSGARTDYFVFNTFADLTAWLGDHFSHRRSKDRIQGDA